MTSLTGHGEPPRYFTFPALAAAGLPHASTTRHCPGVTSPLQPTSPFTTEARAEGDSPLDGENDYDVPTFLRRSAD